MDKAGFASLERVMAYGKWLFAGLAAFFASVPALVYLLMSLMVIDTLFGLGVAIIQKDLSSSAMWLGVIKKLGNLGVVVVAALVAPHIGQLGDSLVMFTTAALIGPELLSIFRNAAILGVPIPKQLVAAMRYFQDPEEK